MNEDFVRQRITELRLEKDISEYQMSYDLGHSKSYINTIVRGKAMPTVKELISICDYVGITVVQFFSEQVKYPVLIQQAIDGMLKLDKEDLTLVLLQIQRLNKNK